VRSLCQHRLSAGLVRKAHELLPTTPPGPAPSAAADPLPTPQPVEMPHGVDPRHIVLIQGKPFVKFAGILALAHQRGL
jgi:hypothetical protein